ncbi:SAM-dependent methyltransferase [Sporichthya sp.]|uniref:SAM-dependent methyltransferase n=1 Tax=Sporichthya sp. TaxID=65475 RepID=UPI0025E4BC50|nr:SAM-dependent methyltransferase [Sporichthya sp.]
MCAQTTWRAAMDRALYGSNGFYRRNAPGAHFRACAQPAEEFATAVARIAVAIGATEVVDIGAGRGALLTALEPRLRTVALHGIEVVARPAALPARIGWSELAPPEGDGVRLLVANEWLNNVPLDVVEVDLGGTLRQVFVAPDGNEATGDPPGATDLAWLARWWPLDGAAPGTRAEVGSPRDQAWAATVRSVQRGLALAVDLAHLTGRRPPHGTLVGYRDGVAVMPTPDGSTDLIAHVALDACAAAGVRAGAAATVLATQDDALRALEVSAPPVPDEYRWLIQAVGIELPTVLDQIHRSI